MGIPSYYKKLIDSIPGLISKEVQEVDWLFMDFNCLIYHCIQDTYGTLESIETTLINSVITYCLKVIKEVNPKGVFIAIDGVVPMAKMRQQRLRRFKSVWIRQHEGTTDKWDKNAITPGTVFMKKLKARLEIMCSTHHWILSSSDEPGEGEHKIIAEWRKGTYKGNYAIYGLDADLIVLSLLGHECYNLNKIWLFREEINAGKMSYDNQGNEIFNWFSINALKNWLIAPFKLNMRRTFILNYCFTLSILGNDFLPSSLGLKMREDGHAKLLTIIQTISSKICIIHPDTLDISIKGVIELFRILSIDESSRICTYITKKRMAANHSRELNIGENNWPLLRIEEEILMDKRELSSDWEEKYKTLCEYNEDIHKEYMYGIQWIWAYYTGKAVCFNWFYPYKLPPLWAWIVEWLATHNPTFSDQILITATDIRPVEQLALVLPLESWSLIPDCVERSFPLLAPQYYPSTFSFDSVGKRYFWECEAVIPVPTILELKDIMKQV